MFLSFFFFSGLCVFKNLTRLNIFEIEKYNYSILFLYSPYCHFCKSIRPEWRKFVDEYQHKQDILIGEINCVEEEKLCQRYKIEWFPSFIWFDKKINKTEILDQHPSYEWLGSFIDKKISYKQITIINESREFENIIKDHNETIYILNYNETQNIEELKLFTSACEMNSVVSSCFVRPNQVRQLMAYQKELKKPIIYTNGWELQILYSFIEIYNYDRVTPFTKEIYDQFSSTKYPLLLIVFEKEDDIDNEMDFMKELGQFIHVSYIEYNPFGFISRTFQIEYDKRLFPTYAFLKEKNYVKLAKNNNSHESIKEWLIQQLTMDNIPVPSQVNFIKLSFFEHRYIIFTTLIVVSVIISIILIIFAIKFVISRNSPTNDCESLLENDDKDLY